MFVAGSISKVRLGSRRGAARIVLIWSLGLGTCFVSPSLNCQVQPRITSTTRGLDQLTTEASVIVHGYVTGTRVEPHPKLKNLSTVVVSMNVAETYKGKAQKSLVFRQYIWDLREQFGAGQYQKGEELVLLLGPVSEYGLTSPVGLEQGRFSVSRDAKGQATAVNGRGNFGLFSSVQKRAVTRGIELPSRTKALASQTKAGPMQLSDLAEAIRTFAGAR